MKTDYVTCSNCGKRKCFPSEKICASCNGSEATEGASRCMRPISLPDRPAHGGYPGEVYVARIMALNFDYITSNEWVCRTGVRRSFRTRRKENPLPEFDNNTTIWKGSSEG